MNVNTYLTVNSADRRQAEPATDFKLTLKEPLLNISNVELQNVSIPASFYNITSANNKINFNDGAAKTATITPGNYSINTLCSALATATGLTCSYNSISMKVTISFSSNFSLAFGTGANSIGATLGYSITDLEGASSYTAPNCPKLITSHLSLVISEMNTLHTNTNQDSSLFQIPVEVNAGEVIQYNKNKTFKQKIQFEKPRNFGNLSVCLLRRSIISTAGIVINSSNNTIGWFYSGFNPGGTWVQNGSVTITAGTYSIPELGFAIQTAFNAIDNLTPNNWTITGVGNQISFNRQVGAYGFQGTMMTVFNMIARPGVGWYGPGWGGTKLWPYTPITTLVRNEPVDLNGSDWSFILKFKFAK